MMLVSPVSGLAAIVLLFSLASAFQPPECHCKQIINTCQAYYPGKFCWKLASLCINILCKQRQQVTRTEPYPTSNIRSFLSQPRIQLSRVPIYFNPRHLYNYDILDLLSNGHYTPLFIISNEQVQRKPIDNLLFGQRGNEGLSRRKMTVASSRSYIKKGQNIGKKSTRPVTKKPDSYLLNPKQNQGSHFSKSGVTGSENKPFILTNGQSLISLNISSKDDILTTASSVPNNKKFPHHGNVDSANNISKSDFSFMSAGKTSAPATSFNLRPPSTQAPKKTDTTENVSAMFFEINPPTPKPLKNQPPLKF